MESSKETKNSYKIYKNEYKTQIKAYNKFIFINYAKFLFPINEFDLLSYFLFFLRLKKNKFEYL